MNLRKVKDKDIMKSSASFNRNVNVKLLKYFKRNLKTIKVCVDRNLFLIENNFRTQNLANQSEEHMNTVPEIEQAQSSEESIFVNSPINEECEKHICDNNSIVLFHAKKSNEFDTESILLYNLNPTENFVNNFHDSPSENDEQTGFQHSSEER